MQLSSYENVINDFYKNLILTKKIEDKEIIIKELYKYIKQISPDFYINNCMIKEYNKIKNAILDCENLIPKISILNTKKDSNTFEDNTERILNDIVNKNIFFLENSFESDLSNSCAISSINIQDLCKKYKIETRQIIIYPGFSKSAELYNGNGFHCANIVTINNKKYLIDCTYSQFFYIQKNIIERIGIVGLSGCNAGIFMKMDEKRRKVAEELLSKGFIELTEDNAKAYFDGFALSYRNGLYYELNNDYSFQTNYTAEDYYRFLNGDDNQINHETQLVLGFQKIPSKKLTIL